MRLFTRFTETDYLETFSETPDSIYGASSIDKAMMNAFTQTRIWVIARYNLTEAEANTIITQGIDFAITQIVDGNWGVHAVIPKSIFVEMPEDDGGIVTSSKQAGERNLQSGQYLALNANNVHWGYFSKTLTPILTVDSGTEVMVEMATHHACDDWD
jgi:acetamidase/formamidase